MSRIARKIHLASLADRTGPRFDPNQRTLETALRGRTSRKVRAFLRRMEPVVVATPRWGRADVFLEDLALDLAVGEPAIGCRTVDLRPMKGRETGVVRQFVLHVFEQLGRRGWTAPTPSSAVDREGFRYALHERLDTAHRQAPHRVALLAHGAEHLPVDIIDDLTKVWEHYWEMHPEGRRFTLLLSGSVQAGWLAVGDAPRIDLVDYAETEAMAALASQVESANRRNVEAAAHFTGGVPELVDAVGATGTAAGRLPADPDELMASLGRLGDEIRGALDIAFSQDETADRLIELAERGPLVESMHTDDSLLMAGLIRRVRSPNLPKVAIRAPAISAMLM